MQVVITEGRLGEVKNDVIRSIGKLDNLDDDSNLDEKRKIERIELLSQIKLLNLKHESIMQQKSRAKLLEQGDNKL